MPHAVIAETNTEEKARVLLPVRPSGKKVYLISVFSGLSLFPEQHGTKLLLLFRNVKGRQLSYPLLLY